MIKRYTALHTESIFNLDTQVIVLSFGEQKMC